uniref:Uncharacterized protein n=1 Tax=Leersia perrieri TaxID=77586 RepID=A0A0D9WED9_9ORYZ
MDATIGDPAAALSVERAFEGRPQAAGVWGQVTPRAMALAVPLGIVFCFVALRIHMVVGIVPGLNMPTSILSFYGLKWVITLLRHCGVVALPLTRQENIFLLTSTNICIAIALTGGFATYIIGMTSTVAKTLVDDLDPREIVEHVPTGQWMLFLFLIGLMGILSIIPFKEIMIIDYRLLFPMGTVTAHLINSFHTPQGAYLANLQAITILKSFAGSFSWSLFQWFYTAGQDCGFQSFPTFGLELYKRRFYFDFSATFIGFGMICPTLVNFALLAGAIISWGFLYPYLEGKKGQWYHTDSPTSLDGFNGYKVFLGITMILTDGIFNFLTIIITTLIDFYYKRQENYSGNFIKHSSLNYDDRKRSEVFLNNRIPLSAPLAGYITFATVCSVVIPTIFNQIKFYHVAALYIIVPLFSFCNAYGTGLTDWSVAPTYAKFTIFVIAAWIGKPDGVIASLVSCGIISAAVQCSAQAMQDFKTGYMTLTSTRAMIMGQIFGVIIGAIINPCIYHAFETTAKRNAPIGSRESEYPCPYSGVYRAFGLIGMGGVKELPQYCILFCLIAFFITMAINSFRLVSQKKGWAVQNYVPSMTAIAIPFFTGSVFTIDMCLGHVLMLVWKKINKQSGELLSPAVAAGLICGEGLFQMPSALFSILHLHPPICMKFIPSGKEVEVVDSFLRTEERPDHRPAMDATIGDPRLASVEAVFEKQPLPDFWGLVTLRSMAVSVLLGIVFCFVGMRIQMTTGFVPALNMPVTVLSFFLLKWVIMLLQKCGFSMMPYTRQENMFLMTCAITCLNLTVTGGYATAIVGLTSTVAKTLSDDVDPKDIVDNVPTGKLMVYFFLIGMAGILSNVPFHQVMLIDYKLLFPTGSVIGQLINSFHTPEGAYVAKFYFDFSATYIGLGMICPHIVNFGLLFGAVISWGFLYPFLESKHGEWYETDNPSNLNGVNGYKVFISVTLIVTDGLINFVTLITSAAINFYYIRQEHGTGVANYINKHPSLNYDDRKRIEMFLAYRIPISWPAAGYIACASISMVAMPAMFSQIKYYHVAVLHVVIPVIGFCNTYATGLTDWSVSPTYSKFILFVFAAWVGEPGAIVASLLASGMTMASLHVSSQAMQDLKSGHMTLTPSRAVVAGQFIGVALSAVASPLIFLAFQLTAKPGIPVGSKDSSYPCPYAGLYRAIGIVGMGGAKELPKHCIEFCAVAAAVTVAVDVFLLVSQKKGWVFHKFVPSMTIIALPFFIGSFYTIDMCVGDLVLILWRKLSSQSAELLSSAVAAGLICGEGVFTLPAALLNLFNVQPPMCMKFLPSGHDVVVVDSFISSSGTSRT